MPLYIYKLRTNNTYRFHGKPERISISPWIYKLFWGLYFEKKKNLLNLQKWLSKLDVYDRENPGSLTLYFGKLQSSSLPQLVLI